MRFQGVVSKIENAYTDPFSDHNTQRFRVIVSHEEGRVALDLQVRTRKDAPPFRFPTIGDPIEVTW